MSMILDRDPGDEHPETGLCVNAWCENAALPDDEFCAECLLEVERILAELESEPRESP